jgi:patatin-like phospholipase/acyl hydrolase
LTIDGGGIRGIIPAVVLQNMEAYAWDYASEKGYKFPKYNGRDGAMAMKDLFNMTAGTSTGSIIAAGLVYP